MSMRVRTPMKFTLGCDPELFMADVSGKLKASCGKIGGSKKQPQPLEELGEGFAIQEDNVAIEFNIPPAASARAFVESVSRAMKYIGDGVNDMYNFHIVNMSAASWPDEELTAPAAQEFGCDPDYNAWTGQKNPRPSVDDKNLRSCGGHVHVGYDFTQAEFDHIKLVKCMDFFMGVPSVLMDEGGAARRPLYGKGGAYREKPFGVEYRPLSNFWTFNPKYQQWVWDNTARAVEAAQDGFDVDQYRDLILDAINNNNKRVASKLVREHSLEVV